MEIRQRQRQRGRKTTSHAHKSADRPPNCYFKVPFKLQPPLREMSSSPDPQDGDDSRTYRSTRPNFLNLIRSKLHRNESPSPAGASISSSSSSSSSPSVPRPVYRYHAGHQSLWDGGSPRSSFDVCSRTNTNTFSTKSILTRSFSSIHSLVSSFTF